MYDVASISKRFRILTALAAENGLNTSKLLVKLGLENSALYNPLRTLKEVTLTRNRRAPNTETQEMYS
jgi:DNA-binding IclR family transcriptional regulator